MNQRMQALCAFLNNAHSFYHTAARVASWLDEAGYTRLNESADWNLTPGGKYYICRGGCSVLAFRIPESNPSGFMISGSHLDYPTFRVKENGELTGKYTRLATEKYGGMLAAPWLDRPLSIAGRVMVQTEEGIQPRLIDIDRDLALIPNVAIHMNRNANENQSFNFAVDMLPLLGTGNTAGVLEQMLAEAAGGKILGSDLYLYVRQQPSVWGLKEEFISAPALDNLLGVWGCAQGFLKAEPSGSIPVLTVFDSEEVGSNSAQGADSTLLSSNLARISRCLNLDHDRMLANSMMASVDMAHALHPNHPELSDATNAPVLNGGVVLKFNASKTYTTCGLTSALFRTICGKVNVPCQTYYNRADMRGGSTLGYISLNHVSVPSVDIGLAQLAMHSCFETVGVEDCIHLENAMTAYYSTTLETDGENYILK
jgi:aspartyl aminopeptidase